MCQPQRSGSTAKLSGVVFDVDRYRGFKKLSAGRAHTKARDAIYRRWVGCVTQRSRLLSNSPSHVFDGPRFDESRARRVDAIGGLVEARTIPRRETCRCDVRVTCYENEMTEDLLILGELIAEQAAHMDAQLTTGSQLERVCRKYRQLRRTVDGTNPADDDRARFLRRRDLDNGMVSIEAVCRPEEAALIWATIVVEDEHGNPLSVGRRTRSIPTSLGRAPVKRDTCCRFPGCTNRVYVDVSGVPNQIARSL